MTVFSREFILEHTELQPVPLIPEIRLHTTSDLVSLWQEMSKRSGDQERPPPYWAVPWVGGIALARYVLDHPEEVARTRVLDLAGGSGLCGIAAAIAGASDVVVADIDRESEMAVRLNAAANRVSVRFILEDLLACAPPRAEVILVGDSWYDRDLAARLLPWLRAAQTAGSRVLTGDSGREYFPRRDMTKVGWYRVPTPMQLEGALFKEAGIYMVSQHSETGERQRR